jgi:hypothetical protein
MRLSDLQGLLYRLITAPEGVAQGLAAERRLPAGGISSIIRGDDRLTAQERVGIYADMYFYRLLAVLKEDYRGVLKVIGATGFHNLVTGYLFAHPPTYPSVSEAGRNLARYIRRDPIRRRFPFLADLAALERALVDSFVAADAAALDSSALRIVKPKAWPRMRLRTHPATLIVGFDWTVAPLLRAVEEDRDWKTPVRRRSAVLVWRKNASVFYRELESAEWAALEGARRGSSFAAICTAALAELGGDDEVASINRMLERWLADGILVGAGRSRHVAPK